MTDEQNNNELIGLGEASRILQCHQNTLRRWVEKGVLNAKRFGIRGDRRFLRSDVEALARWDKGVPTLLEKALPNKEVE